MTAEHDNTAPVSAWYARLCEPFPLEALREVTLGRRQFLSICAYYIVERLNTVFGPCGAGWGTEVTERISTDKHVVAIGHVWYLHPETRERCVVQADGDGRIVGDSLGEAYKMARTNLLSKAASYMGVGLPVYQGRGIDAVVAWLHNKEASR